MMPGKSLVAACCLMFAGCTTAEPPRPDYHVVAGSIEPGRGPDGNSVLLEAPQGLILVDTGRHPEHRDKLLAYIRERGRPVAAIVNTHWHLDHTTGNAELRAAFPDAPVYASNAIDGALNGFLAASRRSVEAALAAGEVPEGSLAEVRRSFAAQDNPAMLRPTRPVTASGQQQIAGRTLDVNLAAFAATEGDVWLYDAGAGLVVAGDLVVASAPFFDTACPEGWRRALDSIAATPFATLIPGHGEAMSKPQFLQWRAAFNALLDCAVSKADKAECIAGWERDAAPFITIDRTMVRGLLTYYLDNNLRAAPDKRDRYCRAS